MAKTVAIVIQEDPTKTHRPVEALRIALGLAAGSHNITVILLDEAVRLLSEETEDIVDGEVLEKFLPSLQHLAVSFLVQDSTKYPVDQNRFRVSYVPPDAICSFVGSVDRVLVF
ncbi:MAG: DsrE family protein [Nitrospira sp.]|nr:DsrE family protein [Nitrospira sp.]